MILKSIWYLITKYKLLFSFDKANFSRKLKMPASKKDLKKAQQKANIKDGIGDAKGRIPSRTKVLYHREKELNVIKTFFF